MKDYRELTISGTRDQLFATIAEIEKGLNDGWTRDKQLEENWQKREGLNADDMQFCFKCTFTISRKGALLALKRNREGNLWLTNIVPDEFGKLTYDEFNYILEEFLQKFARPAAARTGVTIETSTGIVTLEDWFSKPTADKLRRFVTCSGGSATHSADLEQWMAFLASAHRDGAKVHGDLLRRWLIEDADCDEYFAADRASEYQFSQELLNFDEQYQGA